MAGYTKLFSSIVASTIWREDDKTRIVWITMLAMKDERHVVEASVPGLADLARVTLKECEAAIKKLSSPDKYSRNQVEEGRRIREVPGGWLLVNGAHYRAKMDEDDRREYQRVKQAEYRKRKKGIVDEAKGEGGSQALREGLEESRKQKGHAQGRGVTF